MNSNSYQVDGISIEWGKPFNEVAKILNQQAQFNPDRGWPNIRCKCREVFGLGANECVVRAPFEDRPVLQVQYELAPIKPGFLEKLHSPFAARLKTVLGDPVETSINYQHPYIKKEFISSVVVYSSTWVINDIRTSLSVYGGTRFEVSGPSAAGLFIDWTNEIKAAAPFREKNRQKESALENLIKSGLLLRKFRLDRVQQPYRMIHHELTGRYITEKDNELRVAQLALYKRELLQTPSGIQQQLHENEIALYPIREWDQWFVSNRWDTVALTVDGHSKVVLYDILPGRGSGRRELEMNELRVEDSRESDALLDLAALIESEMGLKVQRIEQYDD